MRQKTHDLKIHQKVSDSFMKEHPNFDVVQFKEIAERGDILTVRKLATAFEEYHGISTKDRMVITAALNNRAKQCLGSDLLGTYEILKNILMDNTKEEYIYEILRIGKIPSADLRIVLKGLVYIYEGYVINPFVQGDTTHLLSFLFDSLTADLTDLSETLEPNTLMIGESEKLDLIREYLHKETVAWILFDHFILTDQLARAYSMLLGKDGNLKGG